jgi:hypothetical protein
MIQYLRRQGKEEKAYAEPNVVATASGCSGGVRCPAMLSPVPADAAREKMLHFATEAPEHLDPHTRTIGLRRFAIKDDKATTAEVEPELAESWYPERRKRLA